MPSCVVKWCKNNTTSQKKYQGITFHRFPVGNEPWKSDWTDIIRNCRNEDGWISSKSSVICSIHFDANDLYTTAKGRRRVVTYAVPKLLLLKPPKEEPAEPECEQSSTSSSSSQAAPEVGAKENGSQQLSSNLPSTPSSSAQLLLKPPKVEPVEPDIEQSSMSSSSYQTSTKIGAEEKTNINPLSSDETSYSPSAPSPSAQASTTIGAEENYFDPLSSVEVTYLQSTPSSSAQASTKIKAEENYSSPLPLVEVSYLSITPSSSAQASAKIGAEENYFDPLSSVEVTYLPSTPSSSAQVIPTSIGAVKADSKPPLLWDSSRQNGFKIIIKQKLELIENQRRKIKSLNQTIRRLQSRNKSLKSIFKNLKKRNLVDTDLFSTLDQNIVAADLFNYYNRKKLKKNIIYSEAVKKFCLTLDFYSPKAYDYIRQTFDTCLPHRKTLAKWKGPVHGALEFTDESGNDDVTHGVEEISTYLDT